MAAAVASALNMAPLGQWCPEQALQQLRQGAISFDYFDLSPQPPAQSKLMGSKVAVVAAPGPAAGVVASDGSPDAASPEDTLLLPQSPKKAAAAQPQTPFLHFVGPENPIAGLFTFGSNALGFPRPAPEPKVLVARMGAALERVRAESSTDSVLQMWPAAQIHQPFVFNCLSELPELVVETTLERQRQEAQKRQARRLLASPEGMAEEKPLPAHIASRKIAPLPPARAELFRKRLGSIDATGSPSQTTDPAGTNSNASTPTTANGNSVARGGNTPSEQGSAKPRKALPPLAAPVKEPPPTSKLDQFLRKVVLPRTTKSQRKHRFKDLGGIHSFDDLGNPTRESGLGDDHWVCFMCLFEQVWGGQFWRGPTERDRRRRDEEARLRKAREKEESKGHVHSQYCKHHSHNGGGSSKGHGGDRRKAGTPTGDGFSGT
jgi:hypothetical protein